jgi:hypothetical protein
MSCLFISFIIVLHLGQTSNGMACLLSPNLESSEGSLYATMTVLSGIRVASLLHESNLFGLTGGPTNLNSHKSLAGWTGCRYWPKHIIPWKYRLPLNLAFSEMALPDRAGPLPDGL